MELVRYIHLNPVRSGLVKAPASYRYSGHLAYAEGKPSEFIDPRPVLGLLGGSGRYREFVNDGIKGGHKEEYYETQDQRFLGPEGFGEKLRERQDEPRPPKRRALEGVIRVLVEKLSTTAGELKSADRSWAVSRARTMVSYVLVTKYGYGLGEVAKYTGLDPATVSTLLGETCAKDGWRSGLAKGVGAIK